MIIAKAFAAAALLQLLLPVPPIPPVPAPRPIASVRMMDSDTFDEVQLDIPVTPGPFEPNWESLEANHPGTPEWLREAKIGIWVHFGPQSAGESGDWYARNLYKQGHPAYENHLKRYGHPSEVGYKDVLNTWNPEKLDPEYLTQLYSRAGARFLLVQGVHHDNYDLWDSKYQPWNSVNVGPGRDFLREWSDACRRHGMRYGVTFHHEYTWWWWQTAFGCDTSGVKAGVPYDGNLTLADGKGTWWEGLDPRLLYGIDLREYEDVAAKAMTVSKRPKDGIYTDHLDYCRWYATQWALRMMDVCANYDPDFIYTDGKVEGPFTGYNTGTGYKCNAMQTVLADYYNRQLATKGKVDAFAVIKFRHPTNGAVTTAESKFPEDIKTSQAWIREAPVGDWFYAPGFVYDAPTVIRFIIESICRDGNVALNIPIRPDGSIEDECVTMLEQVGDWLSLNGAAVYGSRAWKTLGEGEIVDGKLKRMPGGALGQKLKEFPWNPQDIRFTEGKDGLLYAFTMALPEVGQVLRVRSLGRKACGEKIHAVSLLGYEGRLRWRQRGDSLDIEFPADAGLSTAAVFCIK